MTPFGRILYWLFFGSRGGESRTSILKILSKTPVNTNKLSELAELDYKTTEHHVKVLLDNGVIESVGGGYGKLPVRKIIGKSAVPSGRSPGELPPIGDFFGKDI